MTPGTPGGTDRPGSGSGSGSGSARTDSLPLLAGAAVGVGGVGAALALADVASPLRAPFTLFFLLAAPALALAASLRRLDALTRAVVAVVGAAALDLLVAQVMIATHTWSVRGGIVAVGVLSGLLLLTPLALGRNGSGGTGTGGSGSGARRGG
ncbi:hypothetical protein ACWGJ2_17970 [Streptomyces sp. NPDC054796]